MMENMFAPSPGGALAGLGLDLSKLKNIKADLAKKKQESAAAPAVPAAVPAPGVIHGTHAKSIPSAPPLGPGAMAFGMQTGGVQTGSGGATASSAYSFVPKGDRFALNPDAEEEDKTLQEE